MPKPLTTAEEQARVDSLNALIDKLSQSGQPFKLTQVLKQALPGASLKWIYTTPYQPARLAFQRLQDLYAKTSYPKIYHHPKPLKPPDDNDPDWVWKLYRLAAPDQSYRPLAARTPYSHSYLCAAVRGCKDQNGRYIARSKKLQCYVESLDLSVTP